MRLKWRNKWNSSKWNHWNNQRRTNIRRRDKTTHVEQIKEEHEPKQKAKPKAKAPAKRLPRTVKVVELVECSAGNKKMLPRSLRRSQPHYCKGQPTETFPVNKQKASYGSKVDQKLRK